MKKTVFISHSTKDDKTADIICASLERAGVGCWIDHRDIPAGVNWAGRCTDAVEASRLFLFLLTKSSSESDNCLSEISVANEAKIQKFCVVLGDVVLNSDLKYHFSSKQRVKTSKIEDKISDIVSSVKAILAESKPKSEKKDAPSTIKLIPNADAKIKELIFEDSVRSHYLDVCEEYAKGRVDCFITAMQILITKLGIMVSRVTSGPKTNISSCARSIEYLCTTVLGNAELIKTFDELGLNKKGNSGKHDIAKNVNIDMLRCVTAYNNIVNRIADKYGLRSLKEMVVRKARDEQPGGESSVNTAARTYAPKPPRDEHSGVGERVVTNRQSTDKRPPAESGTTEDENLKVKATLKEGQGRYTKTLLGKKKMVNFKLVISIENPKGLKISSITATVKGRGDELEKRLPTSLESVTEFDLPVDSYGGNVEATVVVVYKIGIFKTKQIKVTVSKSF